jgi:hypothetical protein
MSFDDPRSNYKRAGTGGQVLKGLDAPRVIIHYYAIGIYIA